MKLLDAFFSLQDHPMLGARYRKLSGESRVWCVDWCLSREGVSPYEINAQINRLGLDDPHKPSDLGLRRELLSNANAIAHPMVRRRR